MKQANFSHLTSTFDGEDFTITCYFDNANPETRKVYYSKIEEEYAICGDLYYSQFQSWLKAGSSYLECSECSGEGQYFIDVMSNDGTATQEYFTCEECDGHGKLEVENDC